MPGTATRVSAVGQHGLERRSDDRGGIGREAARRYSRCTAPAKGFHWRGSSEDGSTEMPAPLDPMPSDREIESSRLETARSAFLPAFAENSARRHHESG